MDRFAVALFGGISLGGVYALIGLGLVLAFRATRTFNFAHGSLMVVPAFTLGMLERHHSLPIGLAILASLAVGGALGGIFYLGVLRFLTGQPIFMSLIATLGLAAILDGVSALIFGANQYTVNLPGLSTGVTVIAGARISTASLELTGFTLVVAAVVTVVTRLTHLGRKIRAAGHDPLLAAQGGIHVGRVYLLSWIAAATLAAIAGVSYGSTAVVTPDMENLALAAIPAIMLGGLDSIEGSVVGGLAIGIVQGFTATYLGGQYQDVITYSLLLVVLLTYPQGFFGTKEVARV